MSDHLTINSEIKMANQIYRVYNIQYGEFRLARVGKNGQLLSHKNSENLMNLTGDQIDFYASVGAIELS